MAAQQQQQSRALPDFKPKRTRYESINYGISNLRKSTPRFTKSPNLVLIRFVLIEIQRFKNVKINREVVYGHPDVVFGQPPHGHTVFFLVLTFSNGFMALWCML